MGLDTSLCGVKETFSEWIYSIWSKFLTYFGKIKVLTFNFIPILAYDPEPLIVDGYDVTHIMEIAKPGDVLIRGYDDYLDGRFIPDELGYSHAGLYVGDGEVIHSAAPCVQSIHVIDFCQADRIMLLRPNSGQDSAIDEARMSLGIPYDFNYETDIGKLYCFELIAACYPQSSMRRFTIKKLFGLLKRECYIAKSIYQNPFFNQIFEINEKTA